MEEMTPLPLPQKQLPEGGRHSPILLLASFFLILISLTTAAYLYLQNMRLSSQLGESSQGGQKDLGVFSQILSTFKFTN